MSQSKWKPPELDITEFEGSHPISSTFYHFQLHATYVDEMYDEAGKLRIPLVSLLLDALHLYPCKHTREFVILPQALLMKTNEYKSDYAISIAETRRDTVSFY